MAFAKSKLKRFNETMSCAPPPSHYNPKDENSKPRGAYIEKTERFKPLLKACAPPPGHYNPKNNSSKLPGAYIEKTERFKPLAKDSSSMLCTPSTSKNSTGLQDGLINDKQKLPSDRIVIRAKRSLRGISRGNLHNRICELEQELFETKAQLAQKIECLEWSQHMSRNLDLPDVGEVKICPDSDLPDVGEMKICPDSDLPDVGEVKICPDSDLPDVGEVKICPDSDLPDVGEVKICPDSDLPDGGELKICTDIDSEGTLSADDEDEDLKIELHSLRRHSFKRDKKQREMKKENERLLAKVDILMDMIELYENIYVRASVETITPPNELQDMTQECVLQNSDIQHLQLKLTNLDEMISDLEKCMKWAERYEKSAVHLDNKFFVNLVILLPTFPNHQAVPSCKSFPAEYQEMHNVKDNMCKVLAVNVLNTELRNIHGDIVLAYLDNNEILENFAKQLSRYVEDAKIQEKKIMDYIFCLYDIIENQHKVTVLMNDELIHELATLLESLTKFEQLSKAFKEKTSRESISADKKILERNQQLSESIQTLHEEITKKILRESELNKELSANKVHISEISTDLERLSVENTALREKNASLNDYVKKVEAEKDELEKKCNILSHTADEIKASLNKELSTKMEHKLKNTVLSCELSTLQSCKTELKDENLVLHRSIEQLEMKNHKLCSRLNLLQEALKKSHKLIDDVRAERKLLKKEFYTQRDDLLRSFKEVQDGFHKMKQENQLQEQLYVEKIASLESECESMPLQLNEQMKNLEAEKEKWKLLFTNLETKIAPFKDQLDAYEHEKNWLLNQNDEKQHELESLSQQYASLLGHQNHKQKIKHVIKIKTENLSLRKEVGALQEKVSKQDTILRKLKSGETLVNPKDSKFENALKENKTNVTVQSAIPYII